MQLSVRDSARLLNVSERTLLRWIKDGRLPARQVNEQYRFHRTELLDWATSQRLEVHADIFRSERSPSLPGLADALRAGGVHHGIAAEDKAAALRAVVGRMPLPEEVDPEFLLEVLLARESLGSTGIGDGVAVPHVRNPIVLHVASPMITLAFLARPIEFDAVDRKPVHALFTIVSPSIQAHLHLLSRLTYGLRQPGFAETIARQGPAQEVFRQSAEIDRILAAPP